MNVDGWSRIRRQISNYYGGVRCFERRLAWNFLQNIDNGTVEEYVDQPTLQVVAIREILHPSWPHNNVTHFGKLLHLPKSPYNIE